MKPLFLNTIILTMSLLLLNSCSKDDTINEISVAKNTKKYAMFIKTGKTGTFVAFDKFPSGDIKVAELLKKEGKYLQFNSSANPGVAYKGAIYNTYNPEGKPGIQKITINASGDFVLGGFIPTETHSRSGFDTFGMVSQTKGYYSNIKLSKTALQIFNPETMERTGEIDFSEKINEIKKDLTGVKTTGIGKFMIERDGKFFTEIFFYDDKNNQVVDKSYIAVVDTKTDELEKVITFNDYKIFAGNKNSNYVNIDDKNDLYISGFQGNPTDVEGFNYRVIRIKSGETEIDKTWNIDANADFGGPDFAIGGAVLNGKMYLKLFSNAIDNDPTKLWGKTYGSYEVDLETKKIKLIADIPIGYWGRSSNHGPAIFNGKPYFAVFLQSEEEEKTQGHNESFYTYNPLTKKSEKVFTVIGGVPEHFVEL